ncbi:MAG: HAMP domain-containing protein [Clostridia bacterium]|nr:HAMP domain-containing protein [Clostridia bacterium]
MKPNFIKKLSIKWRITLWYTMLLALLCAAAVAMLVTSAERAVMAYYEETLRSASVILLDEMEVEHGLIEIDADIDEVPNVHTALFEENGNLIYGRKWVSAPFAEDDIRIIQENGHNWYILDTYVSVPGYESIWLRAHMSSDAAYSVRSAVRHDGLFVLAALVVLALIGGYFLTARAFSPVHKMSAVAQSIAGGEDLSARIPLGDSAKGDELHELGMTLNDMLNRLDQSFRREMQFTSDAAHELRTPLNRMITQAEFALSREDMQEKDDAVSAMLESANDMNALIAHLLLLSRMDSGQTPIQDECDIGQIAAQIAEDMFPLIEEKEMTLRLETVSCVLRANRSILSRMLINLMDNAIRYGKTGGEIAVSMKKEQDRLFVTVQNEGDGMTESELEQAFTRFWRADSARTTPGTGIGLSLVQSGAKLHGGSVSAQSKQGEYAAFTIELPIKK